jgi:hypothetical protein
LLENKNTYIASLSLSAATKEGLTFGKGLTWVKISSEGGYFQREEWQEYPSFGGAWIGRSSLRLTFPRTYELCGKKQCLVNDCLVGDEWVMNFRRPLSQQEGAQRGELTALLDRVQITEGKDRVVWSLEKSGSYTTKSMYMRLLYKGRRIEGWNLSRKINSQWRSMCLRGWSVKTESSPGWRWREWTGKEIPDVQHAWSWKMQITFTSAVL